MSSDHYWLNNPGFTSVSIDFKYTGEPKNNDPRLYWAFQFFSQNQYDANAAGGYFGYQPFGSPISSTANGREFPLVNYSIWGADSGFSGSGGESGVFTNEGWGLRTYIPYFMKQGQEYSFELAKVGRVITLWVTDKNTSIKNLVGSITTKIDVGNLLHAAVWTEIYSPVGDGTIFEPTFATWSNVRLDGKSFSAEPYATENYSSSSLVSQQLTRYKSYDSNIYNFVTGPETLRDIDLGSLFQSVNEGASAEFKVSTRYITDGTTLKYTIANISASDIIGGSLEGSFAVGPDGSAKIYVPLAADQTTEGDETLTVTVQGKSASTVVKDTSTGMPATISMSFTTMSGSANEGNSGLSTVTVQATLSAASIQAVTVPITYSGTATSGTDYTNAVSSITIVAGQTTGSASFAVVGDTTVESNETVILTMGTPTNATLGANTSYTHTIVNDDTGQAPTTRTHTLTVLVDKGVLGTDPVLLKDLVEKVTTVGTTVTAHTVSYQGVQYKYGDVDALITTVIRDGEFTEEFRKEIAEQYPSYGSITYRDAVSLVGITNMDATLIRVAGMDGNFVA
jgi:hypothetical protein